MKEAGIGALDYDFYCFDGVGIIPHKVEKNWLFNQMFPVGVTQESSYLIECNQQKIFAKHT